MSTPPPPGPSYPPYPQQPQPGAGAPQYAPPAAPPQGPYGAPGPYGQPQPYGQQQPYGQAQPYGQQPGAPWGMPPMGPPPRKSNAGKITAIVIGVVVGCFLMGGVVREFQPGAGASHSAATDGPRYRLTVPRTLDGGAYERARDLSEMLDAQVPHDGRGMHGMKTVGGQYAQGAKSLTYTGMYGTIDDPEQSLDSTIKGMNENEGTDQPVPEEEFTPEGDDAPVTCGVLTKDQSGTKVTVPFCAWADGSHQVTLMEADGADPEADPHSVDLQAFADKAGRIRDEVRVEAG